MTHDATHTVAARIAAHAERASRLPLARTAPMSLGVAMDTIEMLGWQPTQILEVAPDMPRAGESVLLARDGKTPEILLVGEPFGTVGMRGEIAEAARSVGVPFLVATDARNWTFMEMGGHRRLTLKDMVWRPHASYGLAALSPGEDGADALRNLLAGADVLAFQEAAAAAVLRDFRSRMAPYMVSMAAQHGMAPGHDYVESLVESAVLSTDVLLPAENLPPRPDPDMPREGWAMIADAIADRAEGPEMAPVPANTPAPVKEAPRTLEGRVFGPSPNSRHGRHFVFEAVSRHAGILRKGSQIVVTPAGNANPNTMQYVVQAHADIRARGAAIEAVDGLGAPCLELTRDVADLSPARVCYAVFGTSRSVGASLACRESGARWKDLCPEGDGRRRAA